MADTDPDEINRRFAELIGTEYGADRASSLGEPAPHDESPVRPRGARSQGDQAPATQRPEPVNRGTEFLDLEFTDEHDYRQPTRLGRPRSHTTLAGAALLALGLLVAMAGLFTDAIPRSLSWIAAAAWVVGLALLMSQALRRHSDEDGPHSRV